MKHLLFLLALALIPGTACLAVEKPNIVVILSDDQGWTDYRFMGHGEIKTPHLDKLAGRSVLFERGYVASPLCRPSLASMVTGRFPSNHGVTGNDVDGKNNRAALDAPVQAAFHQFPSFVRLLTANGYLAHQSGKWWEGSFKDGGFTRNMTPGDPDGALQYRWCVSGDWKLLVRHHGSDTTEYKNIHIWDKQPVRLYNLKDDPHEKNELSAAHPEIVERLRKKIETWHPVVEK